MDASTATFIARAQVLLEWEKAIASKKYGDKTKVGNQLHVLVWVNTQAH